MSTGGQKVRLRDRHVRVGGRAVADADRGLEDERGRGRRRLAVADDLGAGRGHVADVDVGRRPARELGPDGAARGHYAATSPAAMRPIDARTRAIGSSTSIVSAARARTLPSSG